jgi:hypothetical protein
VQYPATDLLARYLARWGIGRVFQQTPDVFPLQALIGTTPPGTTFQLAFCSLLYNLLQVVRASVATAQARPPGTISTDSPSEDVQRQLGALTARRSGAIRPRCTGSSPHTARTNKKAYPQPNDLYSTAGQARVVV